MSTNIVSVKMMKMVVLSKSSEVSTLALGFSPMKRVKRFLTPQNKLQMPALNFIHETDQVTVQWAADIVKQHYC